MLSRSAAERKHADADGMPRDTLRELVILVVTHDNR
jgi:hypothetical protein